MVFVAIAACLIVGVSWRHGFTPSAASGGLGHASPMPFLWCGPTSGLPWPRSPPRLCAPTARRACLVCLDGDGPRVGPALDLHWHIAQHVGWHQPFKASALAWCTRCRVGSLRTCTGIRNPLWAHLCWGRHPGSTPAPPSCGIAPVGLSPGGLGPALPCVATHRVCPGCWGVLWARSSPPSGRSTSRHAPSCASRELWVASAWPWLSPAPPPAPA